MGSNTEVIGVDCLGLDLRIGGRLERLMLEDSISSPDSLLRELESGLVNRLAKNPGSG